ncbi:MAG TPA: 1-deoxy-D-xylulose-5-phosphate reductoisomerase, partial [Chitinophagaceae bacterium]|nr:1-deoxy-D-xylulose-5-phosphate reductoisomerase [Chitinophagaceae bacterium]
MQKIAILGATGSIGTQTLEVVKAHPDKLGVYLLSGHSNAALLIEQALAFDPKVVVVTDEKSHAEVKNALSSKGIQVLLGQTALNEAVCHEDIDMVVAAIVGYAGLSSTLSAIRAGKDIALANKETLVVAGPIVMEEAKKHGVKIIPVDSEHSAIFQCLVGENLDEVEKVILSASGGPFLGKKPNFLVNVKKDHALQHPN